MPVRGQRVRQVQVLRAEGFSVLKFVTKMNLMALPSRAACAQ